MNCPNCGEGIRPGQRFCASCGTRLERQCASCAAPLPEGARFCPACGAPVAEVAAADAAPRNEAPVERRRVSVLFVDLVGFTGLARRLEPEETGEFQATYFATATEIISRYGGTIEKFVGDAVMALWGAPAATEDDAERALRAGLDLVAAVAALPGPGGTGSPAARAGVATGEVAVSRGSGGDLLASGEPVNLAARLQSAADAGTVLTDDVTRRVAEAAITFVPAADQSLKGFPGPVPAWRAVRVVGGRRGTGRTEELEPPFTGRDPEVTLLKELFHATARERRLRVVSITGQAGIGKSRLAWEFEKYVDGITGEAYWHQGRSPAYGEGITFWALGEMVRRRAGVLEDDDAPTTMAKVGEMLHRHVPDEAERARVHGAVGALLGTEPGVTGERGELFGAWRVLFERIAEQAPVVLVFEDLQWADAGLLDFIAHLLEWSRQHAIFVVTLARPDLIERFPTWGAGQRNFTSLHLEPLTDAEMGELLAGLVPGLPPPTVRAILRRAEGVPLYAVETVRMLVSDGALVRDGDAYRATRPIDDVSVPASLHALVAARIDGLAAGDRGVLQHASVLGSSFSVEALTAVAGQAADRLLAALDRLVAREILRLETDPRSPERGQYQFVQAVIREVAYAGLTRRDRKERHLAAARFFEARGDEELAGALAGHYLDAWRAAGSGPDADALAAQARVALRGAAERAIRLHSYAQSLAFWRLALDVTADDHERAASLEQAGIAAWHAPRHAEAEKLLHEALEVYERVADEVGAARVALRIGRQYNSGGRTQQAVDWLSERAQRVPRAGAEAERIAAAFDAELARAVFLLGDRPGAIRLADAAIGAAERLDAHEVLVDALTTRGSAIAYDRPREGQAILYGSIVLASRFGLIWEAQRARNNLKQFVDYEDPDAANELEDETLAIATRLGMRDDLFAVLPYRAYRLLWAGDTRGATQIVDELLSDESIPDIGRYYASLVASEVAALEGDPARSARERERAETISRPFTNPEFLSALDDARGRDAMLAGDLPAAIAAFESFERSGYADGALYPFIGRVMLRAGRVDDARRRLDAADAAPQRGAVVDAAKRTLEAALAAAAGDVGAATMFVEAIQAWRDLGRGLDVALAQLDFVRFVGLVDPAAREAADELRRTCVEKGWNALLAQLDSASAAAPAESPRTPSRAGVHVSRP